MHTSLTLEGVSWPRSLSLTAGVGMGAASVLTIQHYFAANYPASIYQGSFCDINAFFNCNSAAFSSIAAVAGVPLGYFGLMTGALVALGALFPSESFERTNKTVATLNVLGVVALLLFSVFYLGSLCLLCSGYYVTSALSFWLYYRYGLKEYARPSLKLLAVFAVITLTGAYAFRIFHETKKDAQTGGVAARMVQQYFSLPVVGTPSVISPYWSVRSTERFEDASIQVVEYGDFLCSDCLYLSQQLSKLKQEFRGKINIAFQFFPLEAECNTVAEKNKHPGACEIAYMAAYKPALFPQLHDEIFAHFREAKTPAWRQALAKRYGLEAALTDAATKDTVRRLIQTGAEYEKTHEKYTHGIRSTPTMIINGRMVIGTFPEAQLRAIFQALVDKREGKKFLENWM